jgi:hypothetical protein
MVDINNFLDLMKRFLAVVSDFIKSPDKEWEGQGEKDERRIGHQQSDERWGENAETKAFPNRECYKKIFDQKCRPPNMTLNI